MILAVKDGLKSFEKIESSSFVELNIWERHHIQEWIRQAPEILGEELLVVSIEFDRFVNSSDRLDVLAIDRQGNLVIIELKRDAFAGYADLQSIRYAAMVSSMTIDRLLPYYLAYQKKYLCVENPSKDESRTNIEEFVNQDSF
jgi:RecB family endonuclease NucS